MRVKLLTFRYSATLGGFDDTPLLDFTRDKEVVAFREHFYAVNEVPHLTCIVHYQDAVVPPEALQAASDFPARRSGAQGGATRGDPRRDGAEPGGPFRRRDGAPDPCEGLSEPERATFNHLREWRSAVAHAEGLPPYLILTNRQVVAIVRARPESPTALGHIDGIGPGKIERYGRAILERLHGARREILNRQANAEVAEPRITEGTSEAAAGSSQAGTADEAAVEPHGPSAIPVVAIEVAP